MAGDDKTSFDPKTWLDPKPGKPVDSGDASAVDFNPKTWIAPAILSADSEAGPSGGGSGPEKVAGKPKLQLAAVGGVLAAVLGGGFWFLGAEPSARSDEAFATGEPGDIGADSSSLYNKAAGMSEEEILALTGSLIENGSNGDKTFAGRQQIFSVTGHQRLMQSLLDLGVPAVEANALGRDVLAALGTGGEEWRVEMWLLDGSTDRGGEPAVQFLSAWRPDGSGVELTRGKNGKFAREDVFSEVTKEFRRAEGVMGDHDFYTVAVNAGIPDSLITEFAKVFSYDFNFAVDVKAGDRFEAMWEVQVSQRGDEVSPPQLVYARMATDKGDRQYFAFIPPGAIEGQWFDPKGQTNVRSLMQTPVDGARISSKFGFRNHPIRKQRILHGGVDFAAPTGTPVYASGDATVQFRGRAGGAGNMIKLDHGEGMITRYLHLHQFVDGLTVGQTVRQGQTIGFVGSTGASTGPHLHYEIIVNDDKLDPLTFDTRKVEPLDGAGLRMFGQHRSRLDAELK